MSLSTVLRNNFTGFGVLGRSFSGFSYIIIWHSNCFQKYSFRVYRHYCRIVSLTKLFCYYQRLELSKFLFRIPFILTLNFFIVSPLVSTYMPCLFCHCHRFGLDCSWNSPVFLFFFFLLLILHIVLPLTSLVK